MNSNIPNGPDTDQARDNRDTRALAILGINLNKMILRALIDTGIAEYESTIAALKQMRQTETNSASIGALEGLMESLTKSHDGPPILALVPRSTPESDDA